MPRHRIGQTSFVPAYHKKGSITEPTERACLTLLYLLFLPSSLDVRTRHELVHERPRPTWNEVVFGGKHRRQKAVLLIRDALQRENEVARALGLKSAETSLACVGQMHTASQGHSVPLEQPACLPPPCPCRRPSAPLALAPGRQKHT